MVKLGQSISYIQETIEIDGVYHIERREKKDRRKKQTRTVLYERRYHTDPRYADAKSIDEEA